MALERLFDTILDRLRLELNAKGLIGLDLPRIDGTSLQASRSAAEVRKRQSAATRGSWALPLALWLRHRDPSGEQWRWPAAGLHPHARVAARSKAVQKKDPEGSPPAQLKRAPAGKIQVPGGPQGI